MPLKVPETVVYLSNTSPGAAGQRWGDDSFQETRADVADSGCDLRAYPGGHRRSGATSIPEGLRLVPGVEVARVNSNVWAVRWFWLAGFRKG